MLLLILIEVEEGEEGGEAEGTVVVAIEEDNIKSGVRLVIASGMLPIGTEAELDMA